MDHEAIFLPYDSYLSEKYDELITYSNISFQLSREEKEQTLENISLLQYHMKPGAVFSPNTILSVPDVFFITEGNATIAANEEKISAGKNDAIYIRQQTVPTVVNTGDEDLVFFSIIEENREDETFAIKGINNTTSKTNDIFKTYKTLEIRSENTVTPELLGNKTNNETFEFYRLIHPGKEPYNISFDLGTVELKKGSVIPEHYVDDSYQLFTILSGSGNISVGCQEHQVSPGDMLYVAPGALMNMTTQNPMHMMVITHPFYQIDNDHQITGACESRIT